MAHRLAELLHLHGLHGPILHTKMAVCGWVFGSSAGVGLITGDGLAAAITVIGLALVVTLGRMTPVIAGAIREWGFAYADVHKRLIEADSKADAAISRAEANSEAIEDVRKRALDEAAAVKAEAIRVAEEIKADAMKAASEVERHATDRRHDLRAQLQLQTFQLDEARAEIADSHAEIAQSHAEILAARAEIAELRARLDGTHVAAINALNDDVHILADQFRPPPPIRAVHLDRPAPTPPEPGATR